MYAFIRHNIWFQMFQKGKILKKKIANLLLMVWMLLNSIMYSPKLLTKTNADQIPMEIHETKNELFQEINFHRWTTEKLRADNRKTSIWNFSQFNFFIFQLPQNMWFSLTNQILLSKKRVAVIDKRLFVSAFALLKVPFYRSC